MHDETIPYHILILTGPMGSGHLRAAQALEETFRETHPECTVSYLDTSGWMSSVIRWIFLDLYPFLLRRCAWVWRLIHSYHNHAESGFFPLLFRVFAGPMDRNLLAYVRNHRPNFILCTHFYPGFMVARLKRKGKLDVPSAVVVTDYAGHRIYVQKEHDRIFVANASTRAQFEAWGADPQKLSVSGIPVMPKYVQVPDRAAARQYRQELGLHPALFYLMVTMGGWAIDDMQPLIKKILQLNTKLGVIAMTGINRTLFRELTPLAAEHKRLTIVPFTNQMEKFLAVSSAVVTKPGGITTAECVAYRKPMLLVDPIAGHEELNLQFLEDAGVALAQKPGEEIDEALIRLFHHRFELRQRIGELSGMAAGAAGCIVAEIIRLLDAKNSCPEEK